MSPHKKNTSLLKKTAWSAIASISSTIGRLISSIILARMLGSTGMGQLAFLIWLLEITNVTTGLGLQNSLVRYFAELQGQGRSREADALAQWIYMRYLGTALLGGIVIIIFFIKSTQYGNLENAVILMVILFFTQGLAAINNAGLIGRQAFDKLAWVNIISSVLLVVGQLVGAWWAGVVGALVGYIIGAIVPAILSISLWGGLDASKEIMNPVLRRQVWKYALNTWLAAIVSALIWSRAEIFFLERYWGPHEVAMFTIGMSFSALATLGPQLLTGSLLPHFAQLCGSQDRSAIQRTYAMATRLVALFLFPLSFGGAAVTPVLLPWLYGSDFIPAVPVAMVLMALSALGFASVGSSLVYGLGHSSFIALGGFLGAVMMLSACSWVVPEHGVWGAVWVRCWVQCSMIGLGTWYIACRLNVAVPLRELGCIAIAALLCAVVAGLLIKLCLTTWMLLVAIPAGAAAYMVALKYLHVLNPADSAALDALLLRLPAKPRGWLMPWLVWLGARA